jgi:hypothetical protein
MGIVSSDALAAEERGRVRQGVRARPFETTGQLLPEREEPQLVEDNKMRISSGRDEKK